jgi:hypothetical protein
MIIYFPLGNYMLYVACTLVWSLYTLYILYFIFYIVLFYMCCAYIVFLLSDVYVR